MSETSSFGTSRRESHNASAFYARSLYDSRGGPVDGTPFDEWQGKACETACEKRSIPPTPLEAWSNTIYHHSAADMVHVPDGSVGLAFTSPPYNVGKEYDQDEDLYAYLSLVRDVGREVYRVLKPGGRYVINVANLGRKPYIPLHAHFYAVHGAIGFLPMGEIIWQKGKGASGSCAWGSWMSARAPRLRDIHEYLLVFSKEEYRRPEKGESDVERDEFMEATLSIWEIAPESAKRVGHPAPFPLALADRIIRLYSYTDDVILDPFNGSGTTCLAAHLARRHYVGYDVVAEYCELARQRIQQAG